MPTAQIWDGTAWVEIQAAASAHDHAGTYVAQSLFDAAGDLLTATANDTPAKLPMGSALQVLRVNAGATALEYATPAAGGGGNAIFGDGSDGVINFDGTTTRLGLVPSSGVYTLTRDIFLADGSQLSGTAVVKAANYRVFCNGTLTIGASARLHNSGDSAVLNAGGTSTAAGTLRSNQGGAAGGTTTGIGGNAASTNSLGGVSGAGGLGPSGAGGAGAAVTAPLAVVGSIRSLPWALMGVVQGTTSISGVSGGASGGGGGGDGTVAGGGGGAGGGVLILAAKSIINSGTVAANGGAGGTRVSGNAGGGGGGGGGVAILVYNTFTGTAATANGGIKGNGIGTGVNGVDGSPGIVVTLVNA